MKEYIIPTIELIKYNKYDCLTMSDTMSINGEENVEIKDADKWTDDII